MCVAVWGEGRQQEKRQTYDTGWEKAGKKRKNLRTTWLVFCSQHPRPTANGRSRLIGILVVYEVSSGRWTRGTCHQPKTKAPAVLQYAVS